MPRHQDEDRDIRSRIAVATITGLLAGIARAVTDWLLRQLPSS